MANFIFTSFREQGVKDHMLLNCHSLSPSKGSLCPLPTIVSDQACHVASTENDFYKAGLDSSGGLLSKFFLLGNQNFFFCKY